MDIILIIGIAAAICSTISFAPQAWKIIKTRDTSSISAGMYAFTVTGFALWTLYGVMKEEWPLIVPNALCLIMAVFILFMKLSPNAQKEQVAEILDPET